MGMFKPEEGEAYKIVLTLKGSKELKDEWYKAYKDDIMKLLKDHGEHGLAIESKEYVILQKKKEEKRRK